MSTYTFENIHEFVGQEVGVSDWITIDQERINQFADCTEDHQWIHVDVEKAKAFNPSGATIAHGFLTLSLLPKFNGEMGIIPAGVLQVFNYGADYVRFLSPVKVGSRIRNRVTLLSVEPKGKGRVLLKTRNTVEIEGEDKPAMVADTLSLALLG